MNVLLSVKPKYSEAILSNKKKYEFRKIIFRREDVNRIYIYSTSPIRKITGYFRVKEILEGSPEEIWDMCHNHAGIAEEEFFGYFMKCLKAFAIKIRDHNRLDNPVSPEEVFKDFKPPQSFYYIKNDIEVNVGRGI